MEQYEDPEALREIPKTWREYLSQMKEISSVFLWAWNELGTPSAKKHYRDSFIAIIVMTAFQMIESRAAGATVNAINKHDVTLVTLGIVGFFVTLLIERLAHYRYSCEREHLLGKNQGKLDECMTERFFEKSVGQHTKENILLNPETISTGRERLLNVQGLVLFEGVPALSSLAFSYIFLCFSFGPVVAAIMTLVFLINLMWTVYLNRAVLEECTPIEMEFRALKRYRVERWKLVERVKVAAKEKEELVIMNQWFDRIIKKDLRFWLWFILHCFRREMIGVIGLVIIFAYATRLVWIGTWPWGAIIPLLAWSKQFVESLWRVGHIERQLNWNMPGIRAMIQAVSIPPAIVSKPNAIVLQKGQPIELSFNNITHCYPNDDGDDATHSHPVLKNVSFTVKPGVKVAVIGKTGTGKSTLMKLGLRFIEPDEGSVTVNGHDLRDIDLASWMEQVAYIPQHPQVFDGSVKDNLLYALSKEERATWDAAALLKFTRSLHINFGKRLRQGLDTIVGERGAKLSGGQAQRIMIGAAAIKHSRFMIIDEATSNLDSTTEKGVHHGLANVFGEGVGGIVITHRLSTVRHLCDQFVMISSTDDLKPGESQRVIIANSLEELYAISEEFRQLADDQNMVI